MNTKYSNKSDMILPTWSCFKEIDFGTSRRGCGDRYQSTSSRNVIDITSLSREMTVDAYKEVCNKDSISINRDGESAQFWANFRDYLPV